MFGQLCSLNNRSEGICSLEATGDDQDNSYTSSTKHAAVASLVVIVTGMMLQGFGKAPRASFTIIYIDDNTNRVKSGFYFGILVAFSILGPAVAFAMGGVFSRIYVTLEDTNLHPKHPKWIGAWWLGFLGFGMISFLVSLPLFCFPRKLPRRGNARPRSVKDGKDDPEMAKQSLIKKSPGPRKHNGHHNVHKRGNGQERQADEVKVAWTKKLFVKAKLFYASLFRILTDPLFVLIVCSNCFILFMVAGASAFSPKYFEQVFDMPAYQANYIMAGKTLASACLGTFIGGSLTRYYKMKAKTALQFAVAMACLLCIFQVISMFTYCPQPTIHNWPGKSNTGLEFSSCQADCHCEQESYFPVCGSDGKSYYSPCTAGCSYRVNGTYTNCTCIDGGQAWQGICPYGCNHVYFFTIVQAFGSLFGTMSIIPKITVIIRNVEERDKSLALGVLSMMTSLLGWLLGPVIFGIIIDGVCDLWDRNCDVIGRCLLYDNNIFRWKLLGYSLVAAGGSFLCQLAALCYALKTGCLDDVGVDGREDRRDGDEKGRKDVGRESGMENENDEETIQLINKTDHCDGVGESIEGRNEDRANDGSVGNETAVDAETELRDVERVDLDEGENKDEIVKQEMNGAVRDIPLNDEMDEEKASDNNNKENVAYDDDVADKSANERKDEGEAGRLEMKDGANKDEMDGSVDTERVVDERKV